MRKLNLWRASHNHEQLFVSRYERLLTWSLHLTGNNRDLAEDLLHDAFIQITSTRRDPGTIEDLESYLYGILRHLHLSQVRRATRSRLQQLTIIEYDSAQAGLRIIDPGEQIQAQDQLRRICHYVCARKETSKAGSILMLRFFLGYYPGEIAQIVRRAREIVEVQLGFARSEAKLILDNPKALSFMGQNPFGEVFPTGFARTPDDFLAELQRMIFNSRRSPCMSRRQLHNLYSGEGPASITTSTLGHIVTCALCLDEVNALLDLPPLSERYPLNTLGKDPGKRGGPRGGGAIGGGSGAGEMLAKFRRRARDTFEHRPKELHISVNGFIQGSQKINSELSELTLDVDMQEPICFVEVFSEQQVRLLLLDVDDPLPPNGPVEQRLEAEFSARRTLALSVKFTSPWPILNAVYHDPLIGAAGTVPSNLLTDDSKELAAIKTQIQRAEESSGGPANATNGKANGTFSVLPGPRLGTSIRNLIARRLLGTSFWLRPVTVTTLFTMVLIATFILLYRRTPTPVVSAAELLSRAEAAEDAIAARIDQVLHRTISLEERTPTGVLITRRKIEVWQSAENGITARRLYDEKGHLVAGNWRRRDGLETLYSHGRRPQLQLALEKRAPAPLSFDDVWQVDISAREFAQLIGDSKRAAVEELSAHYVISDETGNTTGLVKASLVLSRADLHAIEQTLLVRQGAEVREYKFKEATFERHSPSTVAPTVFAPEPELLGAETETPRHREAEMFQVSPRFPIHASPVIATAELEVEVLRLLNQKNADYGEQISISRTSEGQLEVEGVVDTAKRKAEIQRALAPVTGHPAVRIRITAADEAQVGQQPRSISEPLRIQPIEPATNRLPVDAELRRYFADRGVTGEKADLEIARFSDLMLWRSRQSMIHAHALRNLVQRFSAESLRTLDPEARSKWLSLLRSHSQALSKHLRVQYHELEGVFRPSAVDEVQVLVVTDDASLLRAVERLFELSAARDRSLRSAFAISLDASASLFDSPQFWRSFKQAQALTERIAAFGP
ncbi:MAG TPA: sigma-70 family RNA polymerase sigma factor [Pyrinomonadaceae bacterium]|nr:sigma-70 family RNA polymerase sigma factor [Pyrinomonadaceae bacterium]